MVIYVKSFLCKCQISVKRHDFKDILHGKPTVNS